ncbi:MAG: hypothetical protein BWY95_02159 [Bacteroidetes bacterium ADurb.BinA104]|nr:MAG: hypothetical protein BWY95_02159 [Bacteroidetes bacterium ADurb.BinA104]
MGAYILRYAGLCRQGLYNIKDHNTRKRTTPAKTEEQVGFGSGLDVNMTPVIKIVVYLLNGTSGDGNQSLFAPFSRHSDKAFIKIKVGHF